MTLVSDSELDVFSVLVPPGATAKACWSNVAACAIISPFATAAPEGVGAPPVCGKACPVAATFWIAGAGAGAGAGSGAGFGLPLPPK